jgi:hypothetical protein
MSGIFDLLQGSMGEIIAQGIGSQLGTDSSKAQSAMSLAIPMLMGALKKNASDPDKASGLFEALMNKHDGSILEQASDIFGGGFVNDDVVQDGEKILGHVFGEKKETVAVALSRKAGLDAGSAMEILKMAAPVVMGMLGKQARQSNVSSPMDLTSIIGNMLGGNSSAQSEMSFIEKLLDQDGDGSIMDDLFNMGKKFFGK